MMRTSATWWYIMLWTFPSSWTQFTEKNLHCKCWSSNIRWSWTWSECMPHEQFWCHPLTTHLTLACVVVNSHERDDVCPGVIICGQVPYLLKPPILLRISYSCSLAIICGDAYLVLGSLPFIALGCAHLAFSTFLEGSPAQLKPWFEVHPTEIPTHSWTERWISTLLEEIRLTSALCLAWKLVHTAFSLSLSAIFSK